MPPDPIDDDRGPELGAGESHTFSRTRQDLADWRAGDARAFEALWQRYHPALEILIAGRIRHRVQPTLRAKLDAEDVLQDVAMTVFGKLSEFEYRGPGSVMAWMAMIAERTINDWIDYWRAGKRHPRVESPMARTGTAGTTNLPLPDFARGPATDATVRERRRRLAAAMATLPEREHLIVLWRFFGGAPWSEIADELGGASPDAVRKECYLRAVPALGAALKQIHETA
jgi:RNA polymerase sigma factor (sigma-70 family)